MRAIEENKEGPLFRFCGVFSEASLSGQRRLLAARLEALQISPQQRAHALAIFVELAQNIIWHGAGSPASERPGEGPGEALDESQNDSAPKSAPESAPDSGSDSASDSHGEPDDDKGGPCRAVMRISLRGNRLDYFAGNYLAAPAADRFRQHMARFDQRDKTGWRALWQGQLQKPRQAGQKGAGLGLMELARRSGTLPEWRLMSAADGRLQLFVTARLQVKRKGRHA